MQTRPQGAELARRRGRESTTDRRSRSPRLYVRSTAGYDIGSTVISSIRETYV